MTQEKKKRRKLYPPNSCVIVWTNICKSWIKTWTNGWTNWWIKDTLLDPLVGCRPTPWPRNIPKFESVDGPIDGPTNVSKLELQNILTEKPGS